MLNDKRCDEIRELVYSEPHANSKMLQNSLMRAAWALGQQKGMETAKPRWTMFRHATTGAPTLVAIDSAAQFARENLDQRFDCDLAPVLVREEVAA